MRSERHLGVSPGVVIWETTRACDLRCDHCRATAMPDADPGELSHDEALDLLDQIRELDPGVLVLTGGDPLKRRDLLSLVREATARGLHTALAPSVTPLLTRRVIGELVAAGIGRVALSLDGPRAIHDAFRGVAGAFDRTLDAIDAVRASGAALQVNTSLGRATIDGFAETARLVAALHPALWSVFFVVPVGRADQTQALDAATCERLFHALHDWSATTGLAVKTTAAPAFRRVFLQREAVAARHGGGPRRPRPSTINEGRGFVFVSHRGEVFPSGFLPLAAGNVRESRLAEIYRHHPLFLALRDPARLEGKCARCAFRFVCGGSRGRAYAATGNVLAEDPACAYDPDTDRVAAPAA